MTRLAWAALFGLAIGCGSNPTGPANEAPIDFTFADPVGDTVVATTNPGQVPGLDLVSVNGTLTRDELKLTLEFGSEITRWTDGLPNGLDGFVYFDVDEDTGTGFQDQARDLGVDFYLDLRDNGFGKVAVVEQAKRRFVLVSAKFEGTQFSVTIPRSAITLATDLKTDLLFGVDVSARGRKPIVDQAPDSGSVAIRPPATP